MEKAWWQKRFFAKENSFSDFTVPCWIIKPSIHTLQKKQGAYIEAPYFMRKILHRCDPNTTVDMEEQVFWASKDIRPGDLIMMDYESTEDKLYRSFHCQCGSRNCRKLILGRGTHS
jgi:hypothetical protein